MPRHSMSVTLYYWLIGAFICCINSYVSSSSSHSHLHTLDHHTFYYESWRYDFEDSQLDDDIISITDVYNNSITLSFTNINESILISINNHTIVDYFNDDDWNEIHHAKHTPPSPNDDHNAKTNTRRRLFLGGLKKWLHKRFGTAALPPPRSRSYWNTKTIKKGRFIGHFPGYAQKRGFKFKAAEQYCDEHYGGLATIFSAKENQQVYGICKELLKKYKTRITCRRFCYWLPWTGKRCKRKCWTPRWEYLYRKKYWKGHNCWIGLQLGKSTSTGQFKTWNDMKPVRYMNWDPGEPNYRNVKHCKKIFGSNEKQCETERVYYEKCTEILGEMHKHRMVFKAGTAQKGGMPPGMGRPGGRRRLRRKKKKKRKKKRGGMPKGLPSEMQETIMGATSNSGPRWVRVERKQKWNNAPCDRPHVPICQKARGQVYGKYIAVRAKRRYDVAARFCEIWYGSKLATITTDEDNTAAMEACNAIDISKRSCWIGLQRPFETWADGEDTEGFENWAPGEPNNAGFYENCAELYGGNGKWNDMGCMAKRYFLCDLETRLQRMDVKKRKKMILSRLRRHKDRWQRYRRNEYRAKIRKQYRKKMMKYMMKQREQLRNMQQKRRETFRQRIFKDQYGAFMGKVGVGGPRQMDMMGGGRGMGSFGMMRRRRRMMTSIHDDAGRKMMALHEVDQEMDGELYEYDDTKCKVFDGLYEFCIDLDGIEVVKYIKRIETHALRQMDRFVYDNNTMSYMTYEEEKYMRLMDDEESSDEGGYVHLEKKRFEYDLESEDQRQCSNYFVNQFQVCFDMEVLDTMMIEFIHSASHRVVFPSKKIEFDDDQEWNQIINSGNKTTKCVLVFDAKVCVESTRTSYIANVFVQDVY
eukprot:222860_1